MASGYGGRDSGPSNRQAVLREILLSGPVSRTEIAARIGLTGGAVSRIVRPLIDAGLVRELPQERAEETDQTGAPVRASRHRPAGRTSARNWDWPFLPNRRPGRSQERHHRERRNRAGHDRRSGPGHQTVGAGESTPDWHAYPRPQPAARRPPDGDGQCRSGTRRRARRSLSGMGPIPAAGTTRRFSRPADGGSIDDKHHRVGRETLRSDQRMGQRADASLRSRHRRIRDHGRAPGQGRQHSKRRHRRHESDRRRRRHRDAGRAQ